MPRGPKTRSAPPASQRDPVLPLVDRAGFIDAAVCLATARDLSPLSSLFHSPCGLTAPASGQVCSVPNRRGMRAGGRAYPTISQQKGGSRE